MRERGISEIEAWLVNFDEFILKTSFVKDMQMILKTLEETYNNPVDIEYTVNFTSEGNYRINLLQCRPQQARWRHDKVNMPGNVDEKKIFFKSTGNFFGGNISSDIKWIIFINPSNYSDLSLTEKYSVARCIGRINKQMQNSREAPGMLMGPGRWGTTTPSLGVPVKYFEINNVSIIVEIAFMRDDLIPDVSYGTHFFQDLVENDTYYVAIIPGRDESGFNQSIMDKYPNIVQDILPEDSQFHGVISIFDVNFAVRLVADVYSQKLICFEHGE